MPRLRNADTGVVINVSDEKAARLGSRFTPVVEEPPAKKAPAKRASSSNAK